MRSANYFKILGGVFSIVILIELGYLYSSYFKFYSENNLCKSQFTVIRERVDKIPQEWGARNGNVAVHVFYYFDFKQGVGNFILTSMGDNSYLQVQQKFHFRVDKSSFFGRSINISIIHPQGVNIARSLVGFNDNKYPYPYFSPGRKVFIEFINLEGRKALLVDHSAILPCS